MEPKEVEESDIAFMLQLAPSSVLLLLPLAGLRPTCLELTLVRASPASDWWRSLSSTSSDGDVVTSPPASISFANLWVLQSPPGTRGNRYAGRWVSRECGALGVGRKDKRQKCDPLGAAVQRHITATV